MLPVGMTNPSSTNPRKAMANVNATVSDMSVLTTSESRLPSDRSAVAISNGS
jgi:hypothetical protein